jgi:hypothetical protein
MEAIPIYLIILSVIYFIIAVVLSLRIKERKNQLFLSLRSTNILHVTNITITGSIIIVILSFTSQNNESDTDYNFETKFIYNLYLYFQIILFISIIFKYHRLVICSTLNYIDDDLENFKSFSIKNHYFQYYFIRILIIITFVLFIIVILISYYIDKPLEPLFYLIEEDIKPIPIIIWTCIFTIENSLLFIYALFILKKDLKANLKKEILFLVTLNVIYSSTIAIDLFSKKFYHELYEQYITLIYYILLHLITIVWPIWSCRVEDITTTYNLTKEAAEDFYLCLSNEKSYNKFEEFLNEDISSSVANAKALELYTRIMNYRLLINLNKGHYMSVLRDDVVTIYQKFLVNKTTLGLKDKEEEDDVPKFDNIKLNIMKCIQKGNYEKDTLDILLEMVYEHLIDKFKLFKESEKFKELIYEIGYETYIRCKLTNCGLMKK